MGDWNWTVTDDKEGFNAGEGRRQLSLSCISFKSLLVLSTFTSHVPAKARDDETVSEKPYSLSALLNGHTLVEGFLSGRASDRGSEGGQQPASGPSSPANLSQAGFVSPSSSESSYDGVFGSRASASSVVEEHPRTQYRNKLLSPKEVSLL